MIRHYTYSNLHMCRTCLQLSCTRISSGDDGRHLNTVSMRLESWTSQSTVHSLLGPRVQGRQHMLSSLRADISGCEHGHERHRQATGTEVLLLMDQVGCCRWWCGNDTLYHSPRQAACQNFLIVDSR